MLSDGSGDTELVCQELCKALADRQIRLITVNPKTVFPLKGFSIFGNTVGSRQMIRYSYGVKINKIQESALVGMVLGDAYLQKTGTHNARLRLEHQADHHAYLVWKTHLIPQLFQGKPVFLERVHPKTHRTYSYIRQQSNASPYLGKMRKLFYGSGKKKIPESLSKWLTATIGFAIWFYDDGYYYVRDRSLYLYLGTVSMREAEIAQATLLKNFNLQSTILDKKRKGFALYFPVSERTKISKMLKTHPVPVMAYKIPDTTA